MNLIEILLKILIIYMIDNYELIYPYAFVIKKYCILNIACMVLKLTQYDMEENVYIKNEYEMIDENEELVDITKHIIEEIVGDVAEKQFPNTFWDKLKHITSM